MKLAKTRECRFDASEELDEEDLKEIENELIETRANALRSQINIGESSCDIKLEENKLEKNNDKNKCLNDASLLSNCMHFRFLYFINFVFNLSDRLKI